MSKWKRITNLGRGMMKVRSQASHGVSDRALDAELAATESKLKRERRKQKPASTQTVPDTTVEEEESPEDEPEIIKTL